MTSLTLELAARAASLTLHDLTDPVRDWSTLAIADTVACAVAGADEEAVRIAAATVPASPGRSALLGRVGRLHELDAAQINGVSAHALDFDDCNLEMDGHPSVSIVPALLALADREDSCGADVLTAYVAGVEAEIRIARLSNPAHAERGWHPTVTFGVLGAAVACGRLLGLSPDRMAVAMGIAASCAAGLRANSGTMTKPLHAGQANRNGLQAALLAAAGFTASPTVLEHRFGFMAAFNGSGPDAIDAALVGWGEDFALLSPGIAIKQHPCCAFVHSAIDAASELRGAIGDTGVVSVEVSLHAWRLRNIDRPEPKDGLDAKFSTQYLAARALLAGTIGFSDFDDARVCDPATRALARRVTLVPHEDPDLSLGHVGVMLSDGRRLSASASVAMGRGPANPMTPAQFRRKFDDCVTRTLSPADGARLFAALADLPGETSMRRLGALTQPRPDRPFSKETRTVPVAAPEEVM